MPPRARPLAETVALAQSREASAAREPSADTIVARQMAQRLFAALKARPGCEISALLDHDVMEIVDPAYDAADRLWRGGGIFVEPCRRILPSQPLMYLVAWQNGEKRNVSEGELLAIAGVVGVDPA